MELRKSDINDVARIMEIITEAQVYFKENGVDQWQNNYPNVEVIRQDIMNDESYVLVDKGQIVATAVISFVNDANYDVIYDGEWLSCEEYVVVHRIAVDNKFKGKGVSAQIIARVEEQCLARDVHSIKVDTHEDNTSMQKLLIKNKFNYCGVIYLSDGSKRVAFEKLI
ncbi:MAG: GNAT family N-acetyltransferase [Turicibacter sp.]